MCCHHSLMVGGVKGAKAVEHDTDLDIDNDGEQISKYFPNIKIKLLILQSYGNG